MNLSQSALAIIHCGILWAVDRWGLVSVRRTGKWSLSRFSPKTDHSKSCFREDDATDRSIFDVDNDVGFMYVGSTPLRKIRSFFETKVSIIRPLVHVRFECHNHSYQFSFFSFFFGLQGSFLRFVQIRGETVNRNLWGGASRTYKIVPLT